MKTKKGPKISDKLRRNGGLENKKFWTIQKINIWHVSGTYSGTTALPAVIAGKCDSTTCTTLNSEVTIIKSCLTDPKAAACTGSNRLFRDCKYSNNALGDYIDM